MSSWLPQSPEKGGEERREREERDGKRGLGWRGLLPPRLCGSSARAWVEGHSKIFIEHVPNARH